MEKLSEKWLIAHGWRIDLNDDGDFELATPEYEANPVMVGGRLCYDCVFNGAYRYRGWVVDGAVLEATIPVEVFKGLGPDAPLYEGWQDWRIYPGPQARVVQKGVPGGLKKTTFHELEEEG